jgi:hypothetical protein
MLFSWDKTAFIELLGVVPVESNDFGADYNFEVRRGPLTLIIGVNEDTGDCSVLIHSTGQDEPVFKAVYLGSPGARVVRDKRGYYIELGAPDSFNGLYDSQQPLQRGLRIQAEPYVSVEAFGGA